jgi:hypothetical protein
MLWDVPFREISLVSNNNRKYHFSFEDMNTPVAPIFTNDPDQDGGTTGLAQRTLYDFPNGTQFYFRAKDDEVDIQKVGTYNDTNKEITFSFVPTDTDDIDKDRRVPFEIEAFFPNDERYTLLAGYLSIFATRRLNEIPEG